MDTTEILFGGAVAGGLAFGATTAFRTLRGLFATKPTADLKTDVSDTSVTTNRLKRGTARQTNCLALLGTGVIRMRGGGYLRGYRLNPQETLFADLAQIDQLYDSLSVMLSGNLPIGSGIQSRLAKHPDGGELLTAQKLDLLDSEIRHPNAFALKMHELDFHHELAQKGFFHSDTRSLWIYIPISHPGDNSRNAATEFLSNIKKYGMKNAINRFSTRSVVRRLIEDEREALDEAERYFRQIESTSPLKLDRLDREEVWKALYFANNENALIAPPAPLDPRTDLRHSMCGERIKGENSWYLLHGSTPVTMITMFVPPESNYEKQGVQAGIMRALANNPNLSFRHSIITEYLKIDKTKAEAKYKKQVDKIDRKEDTASVTRGLIKVDRQDKRKKRELIDVQDEMTSSGKEPIQMRFYVTVYGRRAETQAQLEESVKELEQNCEELITCIKTNMRGADVALEDPAALRALYETTLVGEMALRPVEREIEEQADSLAIFIPAESCWKGTLYAPHSFFQTTSGKLIGVNLFTNHLTTSTTCVVLGETGSGKTVFVSRFITDILAHVKNARVLACDFGESLRPMVEVLGGRHLRFVPTEIRTLNIWDYEGLERAIAPDQEQIELVVEDTLLLLQFDIHASDFRTKRSVLRKCVRDVYTDEIPRNKSGKRRHEPVLENLVSKLRNRFFESADEEKNAQELAALLEDYLENPWLNSPTHDTYRQKSPLDVFELDSLDKFPSDVRRLLAFRVGARIISAIGETENGEFLPTLNIFDEMHKYKDNPDYAVILTALQKGARQGRKTNTLTMLVTHSYHDIEELHGIVENTGIMMMGKQTDIESLKKIRKWTDAVEKGIYSIRNVEGSHAQYVLIFGKGDSQQAEMVHVSLSPIALWTYTSNPLERNARTRLKNIFPNWTTTNVVAWLAERYPHGLKLVGKTEIDEEILAAEIELQQLQNNVVSTASQKNPRPPQLANNDSVSAGTKSETRLPGGKNDDFAEQDINELLTGFFGEDQSEIEREKLKELGIDIPGVVIVGEKTKEKIIL